MASMALKSWRWLTIGVLAAATVVACGGRDTLPTGWEEYGGGEDAGTSFGGSSAGRGGTPTIGGKATAGAVGKAGSGGMLGGTAGGGALCQPGTRSCDVTGTLVLTCAPDGSSYLPMSCEQLGQRCLDGACRPIVCTPGELFCDGNDLVRCNELGTLATVKQQCAVGEYCDAESASCQDFLCRANQPVCNGTLATLCDDSGTKYLPGGKDCSLYPGERCRAGSCSCDPSRANCNGIEQDGCEISLTSDPDNCGDCGVVCSNNHVPAPSCDGTCNGACQVGFADCDGDRQGDGCETATNSDASNCGGCGVLCSSNNVAATCSAGKCNGKCVGKFRDCNGDKQSDGCEIDTRSDVDHCGGCDIACSGNHVARSCANSQCNGTCAKGFANCNGNKQADGCEVDTQGDANNCGGCGTVCPAGSSCSAGKCTSLYTFSGIKKDLPTSALLGWSECFSSYYGDSVSLDEVLQACNGDKLMMACRVAGSSVLQLAAYAAREDVTFDTGSSDVPHDANGVGWYFSTGRSWGFAPAGAGLHRYTCDIVDSALEPDGLYGDQRLCWHTSPGYLASGWRCGQNDMLNSDFGYERVLFTAP
jgi:hypothetical protein